MLSNSRDVMTQKQLKEELRQSLLEECWINEMLRTDFKFFMEHFKNPTKELYKAYGWYYKTKGK